MKKIVFFEIVFLYCLILSGCSNRYFLQIQTYPIDIFESDIGDFNIFFWRFRNNYFWGTIDYDLKKDLLLYKDSVKIYFHGEIQDWIRIYKENDFSGTTEIKLSGKGRLFVRFYPLDPFLMEELGRSRVFKGDTVILRTQNALLTSSGVFSLDSVRFVQGERFKFKDKFVGKKGGAKYGHYSFSL